MSDDTRALLTIWPILGAKRGGFDWHMQITLLGKPYAISPAKAQAFHCTGTASIDAHAVAKKLGRRIDPEDIMWPTGKGPKAAGWREGT